MDCGPTCLRMVAKHYGKNIAIQELRKLAEVSKEGVSLLGISNAAEKIGFKTRVVKITFNDLIQFATKPAILHWGQNHFVVISPKSSFKKIHIADPAKNIIHYTKKEFLQQWLSNVATQNGEKFETGIALLLEPSLDFTTQNLFFNDSFLENANTANKGLGWKHLAQYFLQQKRYLLQLIIGLLVGSILQLIFPFLTQSIVDTGIQTHNLQFIYIVLIAQFALFFGRTTVEFIRSRILLHISTKINLSILSDFWIKLMKLPISYFDTKLTGDIIQRLGDHKRIESFLTGSALNTLFSMFNLVVFSFVMLQYNSLIFLIFLAGSILYFFWIQIFLKFRRNLDYKRFAVSAKENTATMQLIHGMQEIKLNNAEHLKRWHWEGLQASLFKLSFKSLTLSQYQQAGAFFINEGKNIIITFFVAKSVVEGQLTLGAMLAVQYIIGQLNSPVEQIISFAQSAQDAKISLERLNEIHQMEEEEPAQKYFIQQLPFEKSIHFQDFSFTYTGAGNEPVLNNISFSIPQNKVTAIVGMSGSGKTTLLKLLLKFYESYTGSIKIGATDLKQISPKFWRSQCGSVMQDGFIFSETIANNIAVSDENVDLKKLLHACKIANILPFVESLPLGFNTLIGAEGNGISAGQKQRLLIARAIYKNPEFLFFDEATNALDANNEKLILENLEELYKGKTVIVVAHRLSTVKNADNIIVLFNGKIVEQGSHFELASKRGSYYELVKNQLELGN